MKIVFLNLADNDPEGIANKSVKALKARYPQQGRTGLYYWIFGDNAVTEYNLIPVLDGGDPRLGKDDVKPQTIAADCVRADKVMLAIHGNYDNRGEGQVTMGFGAEVNKTVSLTELVALAGKFLPAGGEYKLTLVMCYGARTATYRLDHFDDPESVDWTSSFAYRFYERLRVDRTIRMTAFTGAVSVDSTSGKFMVQTEAAISAEIDLKDNAQAYEKVQMDYNKLLESADGTEYYKKFQVLTGEKPDSQPSDDPKLKAGYAIVELYAKWFNQQDAKFDKSTYGKIYLSRPNETTLIYMRHPLKMLYPPHLAKMGADSSEARALKARAKAKAKSAAG